MAPDPQQQPSGGKRPRQAAPETAAPPVTPEAAPEPLGGEPACLLDRVCPECGRLADAAPPTTCPRCGAAVGDPD